MGYLGGGSVRPTPLISLYESRFNDPDQRSPQRLGPRTMTHEGESRPRGRGNLNRGPSVPRGSWGREGTPPTIIKQRGAEPRWLCTPFPLPKCPHTRKEKISHSDDEIAAGLGREGA